MHTITKIAEMTSSSLMGGLMGSRMPPPSAGMMMPGSNPYGPSGSRSPSLSGSPFSATSGEMSIPPGGSRMSSMYPSSAGGLRGSLATGTGGHSGGGGASHPQHPHHLSSGMVPGGGGGSGGIPPTLKPSSILNTVQLQQLSAQLKAY